MALEVGNISIAISNYYPAILGGLPDWAKTFLALFTLVLVVFLYSFLIWKMHKFIARKNIIELNLRQYNTYEHPALKKITAWLLYFLEYIIILPFLIFFWFAVFAIFVMMLNEDIPMNAVLIISAVIVGSIRFTAYYKESLSRELAKLLPLNLLIVSIIRSGFIGFENIFTRFSQVPDYISIIPYYLGFIIGIEIILRILDIIFSLFGIEYEDEEKDLVVPKAS